MTNNLFLIKAQHAHLIPIHVLESVCLQIGQVQNVSAPTSGFEEIVRSSGKCRSTSRDLATPYNQYVKMAMSAIINTKLNKTER